MPRQKVGAMEKFLPQTKLQKFLGLREKVNPKYYDFRRAELQSEIDKEQVAMREKKCTYSPSNFCCAEECAHFKDGAIKKWDVGFMYPVIDLIKFSPSCKLWKK